MVETKGQDAAAAAAMLLLGGHAAGRVLGAGWVAGGSQAGGGCAHGWGMWVYPGRERRGGLFLLAGGFQWELGQQQPVPAAAFPGEQLRLKRLCWCLHPSPGCSAGTIKGSLWVCLLENLWRLENLLRLSWGVLEQAQSLSSSDQPAEANQLLVRVVSICHHGSSWRHRLGDALS